MTRICPENNILIKSMILTKRCKSKTNLNVADLVERLFEWYGRLLARHPWPFIITPLIMTSVLALGVFRISVNDDLRFLYTQPNSPSLAEFRAHQEFQNLTDEPTTYVNIAIVKADGNQGGNVLERNYSRAFLTVNNYILNNLTFTLNGRMFNFGENLCNNYSYCRTSNEAVRRFLEAYFSSTLRNRSEIKLTYPVMTIFGTKIFLAANFYGVTTADNGIVTGASLLCLTYVYRKNFLNYPEEALESAIETGIENYLYSVLGNDGPLSYSVYSLNMLKSEIAKNTWCTLVYLPLSVVLLVGFTLATTCTTDSVTSKPLEGLFGVFTSLLAVMSASGLLFLAGVSYNSTVSVMPFLTLALAVDDTYIILAAWHHTDKRNSIEERLGETLKESGTAITVTALTDVFSFAIGSCSSTPAISAFCQFTAAAVTFDYLYQLTFFGGITALGGRREANGRHCIFFWLPAKKLRFSCSEKKVDEVFRSDNSQPSLNPMESVFKSAYANFVSKRCSKIIVLIVYVGFLTLCFYGCIFIKVNLTPSKILIEDSPLNRHINLAETYIWKQGLIGMVYVTKSPDFRNPIERDRFESFVERLENTTFSMGHNSTLVWFREFKHHRSFFQSDDRDYYRDLWRFTKLAVNKNWGDQLRWSNDFRDDSDASQARLVQFYFTSGFHIQDWVDRTKMVRLWRSICQEETFANYSAFVYDENNFFADQIDSLAPNTIQDCGIAFFCMAFICGLFIANKVILFWVLWSLFAMNLAVIGLLAWWRCDLDPSSVTSILMSIGLTVDFTAHVGYHFSRCKSEQRADKMRETLAVAGWPLVQGAISTVLAIFALVFVRSYVVQVFFRTVLLVVSSGLLHALLFLPVLFLCTVGDEKKRK